MRVLECNRPITNLLTFLAVYNGENGKNQTIAAQISAGTDHPVESGRPDARIFCFIVTSPKFESRAKMINSTWAPRCDKYMFMSSANGKALF